MIISIAAKKILCNVILTDPDEIMKMKLVKKVTANDVSMIDCGFFF